MRGLFFACLLAIGALSSGGVLMMGIVTRASALIDSSVFDPPALSTPLPAGTSTATPATTPVATPTPNGHVADTSSAQATPPPDDPAPTAPTASEPVPVMSATLALVASLVDGPDKAAVLLDEMNATRAKEGLPALIREDALAAVARTRAENLVANGYFDHYSPAGESAFSELASRGIRYRLAGENLARNNYPDGRTATAAFEALMASPGHRANILEPRFTHAGVAAVRNGRVWLYVTVFTD